MSTQTRTLNSAAVLAIMNKRDRVLATQEGKKVRLTIQGNGNVIYVTDKDGELVQSLREPGTGLQKRIFNTRANSEIAMQNDRNKQLMKDARAAEKAGKTEEASGLFNDYLNAVQLSFGILLPSTIADKLSSGMDISAEVVKITTPNGSLLTIDPSTICIMEPEKLGKTVFAFDDEDEDVAEAPAPTVAKPAEA